MEQKKDKPAVKALPKKSSKAPNRFSLETQKHAVQLYHEGKSFNEIQTTIGAGHKALKRWFLKLAGIEFKKGVEVKK
jgi:transposase-like protein